MSNAEGGEEKSTEWQKGGARFTKYVHPAIEAIRGNRLLTRTTASGIASTSTHVRRLQTGV